MSQKIRVLVADDSPFVCRLLTSYLHSAPDFEVVDAAFNGRLALEKVKALGPDALTLDLEMPEMDGLEALARIMRECPTPVVAVSGVSGRAATRTLQALDLGAVDFVLKYAPGANVRPADLCREILAKVRAASRIQVVRSVGGQVRAAQNAGRAPSGALPVRTAEEAASIVVVIGASTGGPLALRELLSVLPAGFPAAEAIVVIDRANPWGMAVQQVARFERRLSRPQPVPAALSHQAGGCLNGVVIEDGSLIPCLSPERLHPDAPPLPRRSRNLRRPLCGTTGILAGMVLEGCCCFPHGIRCVHPAKRPSCLASATRRSSRSCRAFRTSSCLRPLVTLSA
jgi:chemotaxis response regulator CheB